MYDENNKTDYDNNSENQESNVNEETNQNEISNELNGLLNEENHVNVLNVTNNISYISEGDDNGNDLVIDEKDKVLNENDTIENGLHLDQGNGKVESDSENEEACHKCGQIFSSSQSFLEHSCKKPRVYNKTVRTCKHCAAKFKSIPAFRKHALRCWRTVKKQKQLQEETENNMLVEPISIKSEVIDSDDTIIPDEDNNDIAQLNQLEDETTCIKQEIIENENVEQIIYASSSTKKKKQLKIPESNCSNCGVHYKNLKHYNMHKKRKIMCSPPPYICPYCNTKFLTEYNLYYHKLKGSCTKPVSTLPKPKSIGVVKRISSNKENDDDVVLSELLLRDSATEDPKKISSSIPSDVEDPQTIKCELCDSKFLFSYLYDRHMEKVHRNFQNAAISVSPKKPNSKKRKRTKPSNLEEWNKPQNNKEAGDEEGDAIAEMTDKVDEEEDISQIDVSVYLTPNGYQCPMCDHYFPFPYRMKEHLNRKVPCKPVRDITTLKLPKLTLKKTVSGKLRTPQKMKIPIIKLDHVSPNGFDDRFERAVIKKVKLSAPENRIDTEEAVVNGNSKGTVKKRVKTKMVKRRTSGSSQAFCKSCNIYFPSVIDCYDHCLKYHNGVNLEEKTDSSENSQKVKKIIIKKPKVILSSNIDGYTLNGQEIEAKRNFGVQELLSPKTPSKEKSNTTSAECPVCLKEFFLIRDRNAHLKGDHPNIPQEKKASFLRSTFCAICKKSFALPIHKLKHDNEFHNVEGNQELPFIYNPKYNCEYCKVDFPSKTHLNAHMVRCNMKKIKTSPRENKIDHTPVTSPSSDHSPMYFCEHCEMKFTSLTLFKTHTNRFCPKKDMLKNQAKTKDFKQELFGLDEKVSLKCDKCNGQFTKRLEYDIHVKELCMARQSVNSVPPFAGPRLSPKSPNEAIFVKTVPKIKVKLKLSRSSSKKVSYCRICKKTFPSHPHYAGHMRKCKLQHSPEGSILTSDTSPVLKSPLPSPPPIPKTRIVRKVSPGLRTTLQISPPKRNVPCTACGKIFSDLFTLQRHTRMIHMKGKPKSFSCIFCPVTFGHTKQLSKHYQLAHPENLKFQCEKCGKRYATNSRCLQHIRKQHKSKEDQNIKVKDLDEELFGNSEATSPIAIESPIPIEIPEPEIQFVETAEDQINTKLQSPRAKKSIVSIEDGNVYTIQNESPGRGMYSCKVCNIGTFTKINALRRHWKTKPHKENVERLKAKENRGTARKGHQSYNSGRPYTSLPQMKCSVCLKTFFSVTVFVHHRLGHFNSQKIDLMEINLLNPYSCEICQKVFTHHQRVQSHLLWHMKANKGHHPMSKEELVKLPETVEKQCAGIPKIIEKTIETSLSAKKSIGGGITIKPIVNPSSEKANYQCNQCSETFSSKYLYGAHVRHSCPNRFNCLKCSTLFSSKKAMLSHMRHCQAEGNLACQFCSLSFISVNDLVWHEKGCVKVTESKDLNEDFGTVVAHQLQCTYCKCVVTSKSFERHMDFHPNQDLSVACISCLVNFSDKKDIFEHLNDLSRLSSDQEGQDNVEMVSSYKSKSQTTLNFEMKRKNNENLNNTNEATCDYETSESCCSSTLYIPRANSSIKASKVVNEDRYHSDVDNREIKCLRSNFSQLMYLLISDGELLSSFGWGSRAIDGVLNDILVHLGQEPIFSAKEAQDSENLRSNIKLFLTICVNDDVIGAGTNESVDELVSRILKICST